MSKKKDEDVGLTTRSTVKTLSIKAYDEQMPDGWENVKSLIKGLKKKYQVIAIRHDRDYNKDDIWLPSIEKPHYHIIMRVTDGKGVHLSTFLKMLNIVFRPGIDDQLWINHGIETIKKFKRMALYLTHDTEEAQLEGKAQYELEELVSNHTIEEIKKIREGYIRVADAGNKVSMEEMAELDEQAQQIGYELKDFNTWYSSLPFSIRSNTKMKTIKESYQLGIKKKVDEKAELNRLCIFIKGKANVGKTYSAIQALSGKSILRVGGGGTGKYDNLTVTTDAIIIDDDTTPNLLNMTDNYVCQAYKRNSNNPYWAGKYFIITSNLEFPEYLETCGVNVEKHGEAVKSRFYVCHIENMSGKNCLICDGVSKRGDREAQLERKEMFKKFRDAYNNVLAAYVPESQEVDYEDVLNPTYNMTEIHGTQNINVSSETEFMTMSDEEAEEIEMLFG